MPDQFTDEQIDVLFAELRATTLPGVRPPGALAARHTVRHRRAVRSVAAGAAVLAVAGGVTVTDHLRSATGRSGSDRNAAAAVDRSELQVWTEQAAAAVGSEPWRADRAGYPLSGRGPVEQHWIRSHHVIGGTYMITMSCAGDDEGLDVVLRSGPAPADGGHHPENAPVVWRDTVLCRPAATAVTTISVVVPTNGMFAVEVRPDASTVHRVAFAYRARLRPAEQQVLADHVGDKVGGTTRLTAVAALSQFLDDPVDRQDNSVLPGTYRIKMSCIGAGAVNVSVRIYPDANATDPLGGERVVLRRLPCGPAPTADQADFLKTTAGAMVVWLEPDDRARGQAAASIRVDHT